MASSNALLVAILLVVLVVLCLPPTGVASRGVPPPSGRHLRTHVPPSWQPMAPADLSDSHSFIVSLPQRNLQQLKARVAELSDPLHPTYQQWMPQADIDALVSTPPAIVDVVVDWLQGAGIAPSQIVRHSDALEVNATVAAVNRAFSASLHVFQHPSRGRAVVALNGVTLPAAVAPHVEMLLGVHNFPFPARHTAALSSAGEGTPSPSSPPSDSSPSSPPSSAAHPRFHPMQITYAYTLMSPRDLAQHYLYPDSTQSNRSGNVSSIPTSVAVAEFDRGSVNASFSPADLVAQGRFADVPSIQTQPSLYGSNAGTGVPQGQSSYDIQQVAANNPTTNAWYWEESTMTWMYGLCLHLQTLTSPPQVISISWVTSETYADEGGEDGISGYATYMARSDAEFVKLAALGVSIVAISGSQGASGSGNPYCNYDAAHPNFLYAEWPASSAYVTAVGATGFTSPTFDTYEVSTPFCGMTTSTCPAGYTGSFASPWLLRCITGGTESAVTGITRSGGGFSRYIPQPSYQAAAVSGYLTSSIAFPSPSYFNTSNRALPDVSMYAFGVPIVVGSVIHSYAGVSAPLFAVFISLLNAVSISSGGRPLGFLNPLLSALINTCTKQHRTLPPPHSLLHHPPLFLSAGTTWPPMSAAPSKTSPRVTTSTPTSASSAPHAAAARPVAVAAAWDSPLPWAGTR